MLVPAHAVMMLQVAWPPTSGGGGLGRGEGVLGEDWVLEVTAEVETAMVKEREMGWVGKDSDSEVVGLEMLQHK